MHLGAYGQAYFAAETMEIVSGENTAAAATASRGQTLSAARQHPLHCNNWHLQPCSCSNCLPSAFFYVPAARLPK